MSDSEYILAIATMSALELLTEVIANPGYLSDPYYREFGAAIRQRYVILMKEDKA